MPRRAAAPTYRARQGEEQNPQQQGDCAQGRSEPTGLAPVVGMGTVALTVTAAVPEASGPAGSKVAVTWSAPDLVTHRRRRTRSRWWSARSERQCTGSPEEPVKTTLPVRLGPTEAVVVPPLQSSPIRPPPPRPVDAEDASAGQGHAPCRGVGLDRPGGDDDRPRAPVGANPSPGEGADQREGVEGHDLPRQGAGDRNGRSAGNIDCA